MPISNTTFVILVSVEMGRDFYVVEGYFRGNPQPFVLGTIDPLLVIGKPLQYTLFNLNCFK
jgi:hypothetical protein